MLVYFAVDAIIFDNQYFPHALRPTLTESNSATDL